MGRFSQEWRTLRQRPGTSGRADHSCGQRLRADHADCPCRLRKSRPSRDDIIDQENLSAVDEWHQPLGCGEGTGEILASSHSRQSRLISDNPGMMQHGDPQCWNSRPAQLTDGRPSKRRGGVVSACPDGRSGGGDRNQQHVRCRVPRPVICVR